MEPEGSLPHSQVPAIFPYTEPAWFSPYPHIATHFIFSPTHAHIKIFYMKHNSAVYVDAYLQMGRSFVQLLSRTTAFDVYQFRK